MSLFDANKKKVLTDVAKLPLGELSKIAIREVINAGAEKVSAKEAVAEKKEEKKEAPAAKPAEKKDK